jgi:hypothetical protein
MERVVAEIDKEDAPSHLTQQQRDGIEQMW